MCNSLIIIFTEFHHHSELIYFPFYSCQFLVVFLLELCMCVYILSGRGSNRRLQYLHVPISYWLQCCLPPHLSHTRFLFLVWLMALTHFISASLIGPIPDPTQITFKDISIRVAYGWMCGAVTWVLAQNKFLTVCYEVCIFQHHMQLIFCVKLHPSSLPLRHPPRGSSDLDDLSSWRGVPASTHSPTPKIFFVEGGEDSHTSNYLFGLCNVTHFDLECATLRGWEIILLIILLFHSEELFRYCSLEM